MEAAPSGDPPSHFSHRQLLRPATAEPAEIDAIVVPTNRPVGSLSAAIELAADLKCLLVVMCSRWSSAGLVVRDARAAGARAVAVDVPPRARMPRLESDGLLKRASSPRSADPVSTVFPPDTSMKRNLGLAIARMMPSWRSMLFLDDDITASARDVRVAAGLLGRYDAVGLENTGYPDHSVVYHARRLAGERQEPFIGGGALLVPTSCRSHFPNIYNEDWFFIFEYIRARQVAVSGRAEQRAYDPFDRPARARDQEFGDCLAEGLYALLDDGLGLADAGLDFWRDYLARRAALIAEIARRSTRSEIRESLLAARAALDEITPELCVKFLAAWQSDRGTWESFIDGLPGLDHVAGALEHLGLRPIEQE